MIGPEQAEALANLLGTAIPERVLPPLWHWTYLLERRPHADLGPDGHPSFGIPQPPGPGRQRMFAGGTVTTYGESGPLTFVTVRNEYAQEGRLLIAEENDLVYRSTGSSTSRPPDAPDSGSAAARAPSLRLTADEALLFRFSALTYNAHRIHYDHRWVRQEGYADLVVHGPEGGLDTGAEVRDAVGTVTAVGTVAPAAQSAR